MKTFLFLSALSLAAFGVFAFLQSATPSLVGTDAYYHLKLAEQMASGGLTSWPVRFPWLPRTVLSVDRFTDHHFLFHVALVPFVQFGGMLFGKWAAVLFATLVFVSFQLMLPFRSLGARAIAGAAFFVLSPAFLYRMSMVRAQSLSLALLLLIALTLHKAQYRRTAVLCAVYVWLYNAFPLVLLLLCCFFASEWLVHRRYSIRAVVAVVGGLFFGLIVNPYFPRNFVFLYHHLIDKFNVGGFAVRVGKEWYPYAAKGFLVHASIPSLLFLLAICLVSYSRKPLRSMTLTLVFLAAISLAMLLRSRRFIELFPVFALLAASWTFSDCLRNENLCRLGERIFRARPRCILGSLGIALLSSVLVWNVISSAYADIGKSLPYHRYRTSAEWLAMNSEKGDLVIMSDWDDFPRLFHFNTHNHYLVGLDPYFLYALDPTGFRIWKSATEGTLEKTPALAMSRRFGARWFFLDKKHKRFKDALEREENVRLAFEARDSFVFELLQ